MSNLKPAIILVSPQLGENIGAAARAMHNFGLDDLRLVNPRDGWPNRSADEVARHAIKILQCAKIYNTLQDAIADINFLYATTARPRDMVKPVTTPRKCAETIRQNQFALKFAVMFGPERTGLGNEEIVLADSILNIPVSLENTSLNLAQAVLVICYEWFAHGASNSQDFLRIGETNPATKNEINLLLEHLQQELEKGSFFNNNEMRKKMTNNLFNIFTRNSLTIQEVRTLRGVIRCLTGNSS